VAEPVEERWRTIDAELAAYGAGLDTRPQLVVLNKLDLVRAAPPFAVDDRRVLAVLGVSCATGEGIDELRHRLFTLAPEPEAAAPVEGELADFLVYRPQPRERRWRLLRTDRGFRVVGGTPDPAELERALRAAGARDGAEVEVGGETLELAR
jgi:hypothetical protein